MKHCPFSTVIMRSVTVFFCFFFFASSMATPAPAASNRNIHYKDQITIDGEKLTLNGIGLLKWKYLVNVYLVGLYKPAHISDKNVLEDIPKRLEFYFFVDMKASDFQDTGFQLMARNVGEEKALGLIKELEMLNSFYRDVEAGQRYSLTYLPGTGVEMALDGKVLGQVQGAEFAAAYFSIWLGPEPVSRSLQDGLFNPATRFQ